MNITINQVLVLAAILFTIGLFGALTRKSIVIVVMCIELMFNAVDINLLAFAYYLGLPTLKGQVFTIFVMVVSAVELGLALGIAIMLYRQRAAVQVDKVNMLKW